MARGSGMGLALLGLLCLAAAAQAEVYLEERFDGEWGTIPTIPTGPRGQCDSVSSCPF